jgi:hypothetical protein
VELVVESICAVARRVTGWCVALVVVALAPSAARANPVVGYQYLTAYVGTYRFNDDFVAAPGKPDGLHELQQYAWVAYDYETIMVHPDHTFTRTLVRYIIARGTKKVGRHPGVGRHRWAVHVHDVV